MDSFFSPEIIDYEAAQVETIVQNLGQTLLDLRVDSGYTTNGETQTEQGQNEDTKCKLPDRSI